MNQSILVTGSTVIALFMAVTMIVFRMKQAEKPTSKRKIILPPVFMSSGALMFLIPVFRISMLEVLEVLVVGAFFSIFLIKSTKFEIRQDQIYVIPSKSFIFILVGLLIIRLIIKQIIGSTISFGETSGMFFLLAFGMILTWRLDMLVRYIQLQKKMERKKTYTPY